MTNLDEIQKSSYFELRGIKKTHYDAYQIPSWLLLELPQSKSDAILDIGCGLGQFLKRLKEKGFTNAEGIDINDESINYCKANGITAHETSIQDWAKANKSKYKLITMSHVLEHIPREIMMADLKAIKEMLAPDGAYIVMVPNGQSNTGAYWMYEDFTHTTLFTAGSLRYVLLGSGFTSVDFLDPKCIAGLSWWKRNKKLFFTRLYEINLNFWNRVTSSSFHVPSPRIYSFELKAKAKIS
jgi:SAM-dependent methyltransferase